MDFPAADNLDGGDFDFPGGGDFDFPGGGDFEDIPNVDEVLREVDENDENRSFWIESVKDFERDEKLQNKVSIFGIIWLERGNSRGWDASVAEELDKVCFKIKCLARETEILVEQQRAANHVLASAISAMKIRS